MPIILTRHFDATPEANFSAAVKKRADAASKTGNYNFIYIVPTRRRVRELQRELVSNVNFGRLPIYTLELFAHELFNSLSTGRRMISPSMQGMIVSEILSKGDFRFFRYSSFRPGARKGVAPIGTIKKIIDQIGYLKENGITPEDYSTMAAAAEISESQKLEEFGKIYSDYEKRLEDKLVDSSGLITLVNSESSRLHEIIDKRFPGEMTAFVEGFYNFKKPELEFLRLISSDNSHSFLIKLDCNESNDNLFRAMTATSRDLAQRGFKLQPSMERPTPGAGGHIREFLSTYLFADRPPAAKIDMKESLFVAGVRDNLREAEFVAERIKEIVSRDRNQKLDRICVASYLPQNYSRLFREVLAKYRIPANITDRYTLESNNVVNAILSFVEVKAADYERLALMRAVTNTTISVSGKYGPGESGSIIRKAARLCRFERGYRAFREAIDTRLEFFQKLGGSEDNVEQTARDVETLKNARRILEEVEEKLSGLNDDLLPDEFRMCIASLVSALGIRENIVRVNVPGVRTEIVERDSRALASFFDVLDEVVQVENENGSGKLPVESWLENLRSALSLTRYNVRQKYGYGVYVTSLEEIRGLEFDHLFIVGLNEGELPARYDPEIFLPLRSQEENRETEPYLQRHLFYQAVSSFRKSLYLVYPTQRNDVTLLRSSFIDAMMEVAEVGAIDESKMEQTTRNIYSVHQLIGIDSEVAGARERISGNPTASRLIPPNLDRCRKAEAARYADDKESEFAGKLTDPASILDLEAKLGKRVYSAAQLESLSRCGFQFFTRRLLQVIEEPEIETSLSAIERGAVLHRILYKFYSDLAKDGRLGKAAGEFDLLLSVGRDVLDQLTIGSEGTFGRDLFEVEREMMIGSGDIPGTLGLFLAKIQSKLDEYGFVPAEFELGFGMKSGGGDIATPPVEIGGVMVQGKIDRIDSRENGLTIFDYKTSSRNPSHQDVIRDRISPQLVLYLAALSRIRTENAKRAAGAAFISINRERLIRAEDAAKLVEFVVRDDNGELRFNRSYESRRGTPGTTGYPATMDELVRQTDAFVERKVSEAKSGRFNLTEFAFDKVCAYCPYAEACRIVLTGEALDAEKSD